jgi:transcriptional regulator with GAF, ATPase, and Fis domain
LAPVTTVAVREFGDCLRGEEVQLDRLIAETSSLLMSTVGVELNRVVENLLQRAVDVIDGDRATLIESVERSRRASTVYAWARPGFADKDSEKESPRVTSLLEQLSSGPKVLVFGMAGGPAPDHSGAKSGVAISVTIAERHSSALVLEAFREDRPWLQRTVERLRLLAEVIANGLHRFRLEQALRDRESAPRPAAAPVFLEAPPESPAQRQEMIVGESARIKAALERVQRVAGSPMTVLLRGETGTGKELFARTIHARSGRDRYPFIGVNCAALPSSLIESELFGHERGAFTGAVAQRRGRFELAHRGTLFLDEIGDLPLDLQGKLLRVLQEKTFERLGGSHTQKVDVRIVAATHHDLEEAVANGQFREDLYYRLMVWPIRLPALRDRPEDIPALVWAIIRRRQQALHRSVKSVPEEVMQALVRYVWPGNIRELENVLERALINSTGQVLALLDDDSETILREPVAETTALSSVERTHIRAVLRECDWRINGSGNAADRLGLHPNTLRFRMKKLGIARTAPAKASIGLVKDPSKESRKS